MKKRLAGFIVATLAIVVVTDATLAQSGQAGRMTNMRLSSDQPIQIESDRLEVRENEGTAVFTGNVSVVQGETTMRSGRMVVHYAAGAAAGTAGSSSIERLEVEGGVHVSTAQQVATGDRASFDLKSEILVLSGSQVVLTEGDNVIMGCRLTVRMTSGLAELEGCGNSGEGSGRVRMLLQPGSQNR